MALLVGPSQAGSWCAVIGMPEFGVEAAEGMGIDLDRLVDAGAFISAQLGRKPNSRVATAILNKRAG